MTEIERVVIDGEPMRRLYLLAEVTFADRSAAPRREDDHNYYEDRELADVATDWMSDGLVDRDDSPAVTFTDVPDGALTGVLREVADERARQDAQWGPQNLKNLVDGDDGTYTLGRSYATLAAQLKVMGQTTGALGHRNLAWVLLEEVFEALEAAVNGNEDHFRRELVQVAAVAVKAVQIIDRGEPRHG